MACSLSAQRSLRGRARSSDSETNRVDSSHLMVRMSLIALNDTVANLCWKTQLAGPVPGFGRTNSTPGTASAVFSRGEALSTGWTA